MLASRRLTEEESRVHDPDIRTTYAALHDTLVQWRSPPVAAEMAEWEAGHAAAGEIISTSSLDLH